MCDERHILFIYVLNELAHKRNVMRQHNHLTLTSLNGQALSDFVLSFVVERGYRIIENDSAVVTVQLCLGQEIRERACILFTFAQYLAGIVVFGKIKAIFSYCRALFAA